MINKKRIACFALASALVIPGAIGLAGCEKGHTHAFDSDPFYEVVLEGETKIARSWRECSCGAEDAHKKVENAVIASADESADNYAQNILDRDINGKTIVFDEGTYSNLLLLRPSHETSTAYSYVDGTTLGEEVSISDLVNDSTTVYHYVRNLNNVVFAGTENAVFNQSIMIESINVYNTGADARGHNRYDAVRERDYMADLGSHYAHVSADGLTFSRLNFNGKDAKIYMLLQTSGTSLNNISVSGCRFETADPAVFPGAVHISSDVANALSNVVVKNSYFDGHYVGVRLQSVKNATIQNNTIKNGTHNAIGIYGTEEEGLYSTGNILIQNNTMTTGTNRAIKINIAKSANIKIKGNVITDYKDDENECIQFNPVYNSKYTMENNLYNGENLEEFIDKETEEYVIKV